ncbi:MAG: type IX secretion system membrane protein PorP/SprF [Bacteroidota bacterium]
MKNLYCALLLVLWGATGLWAQQESHYTQFMYNQQLINPAFSGERGVPSIYTLYRQQWIGYEGAPRSGLIGFSSPFLTDRTGFGLVVSTHSVGIFQSWLATMSYSYNLPITENFAIRFGVQGNMKNIRLDFSDPSIVKLNDVDPAVLDGVVSSRFNGNFGAGILAKYKEYFLGFSIPHIFPNEIGFNKDNGRLKIAREEPHFYLSTGITFPVGTGLKLRPMVLAKYVEDAPGDLDINVSLIMQDKITAGLSYRLGGEGAGESVDLTLFYQVKQLGMGVAYDVNVSSLRTVNSGSFEIIIRYDFEPQSANDLTNPRSQF